MGMEDCNHRCSHRRELGHRGHVEFGSREDDQEVKVDRVKFHRKMTHIRKMKLEQRRNHMMELHRNRMMSLEREVRQQSCELFRELHEFVHHRRCIRNLQQVQHRNHKRLEQASLESCKELEQVLHIRNRQQQERHSHNRHHQLMTCDP